MSGTIVFTGGGSGGHVFPGLAVAEYLKTKWDGEIVWIGSGKKIERSIVERWGLRFYSIPSGKLRRYFSLRNAADVFLTAAGLFAALALLRRLKPALLFSKGGYVSVPPVVAARLLGIPVFTHESDLDPGLATKINARFANRIFVAYEESTAFFRSGAAVTVSGNPVRAEIYRGDRERGRALLGVPDGVPVLLALGGSQGSLEVNTMVREALPALTERFFVVHQTGETDAVPAVPVPARSDPEFDRRMYRAEPFITDEYPDILAAADLVVSRSGAGTLWELAATGTPSILVPLGGASSRGDQVRNAKLFEKLGAAAVLGDDERTGRGLTAAIDRLTGATGTLSAMREAALRIGRARAAETIGEEILKTVGGRV
jgi:UDP-N-acetylglucosamine--N-acetylmuramyl-(pentapeptide) pyrophosphoryl-undecaprenol N-acetylglucosamine transferase